MVTCNYLLGRKYCSPVPNCKDFTFVRIKNALYLIWIISFLCVARAQKLGVSSFNLRARLKQV